MDSFAIRKPISCWLKNRCFHGIGGTFDNALLLTFGLLLAISTTYILRLRHAGLRLQDVLTHPRVLLSVLDNDKQ